MASIGTDIFIAEVFNYLCRGAALVFGWDRRSNSVREFLRCLDDRRITITGTGSSRTINVTPASGVAAVTQVTIMLTASSSEIPRVLQ